MSVPRRILSVLVRTMSRTSSLPKFCEARWHQLFFAVIFLDSRDGLCRKGGRTWNLVLVQKCFEYKIFLSHHELFFLNKATTAKTEQPIFSHGKPEIQRYPLIRLWTAQELAKHNMKSHWQPHIGFLFRGRGVRHSKECRKRLYHNCAKTTKICANWDTYFISCFIIFLL